MQIDIKDIAPPIPANEMKRVLNLSGLDLDYSSLEDSFKDLTELAARVTGTNISLVNLIDSYTQWTVARVGLPLEQMPREDSVCQYTIMNSDFFEVKSLSKDDRFKDKFYVTGHPGVEYYLGVPLTTCEGQNIGALCVLDKTAKHITPEKIELLKIIANEIVNRLKALSVIENLKVKLSEAKTTQLKVAHDIRGPLGGIIGLARIICEKGESNNIDEVLQFIKLVYKSGNTILELADEILTYEKKTKIAAATLKSDELNLAAFKEKLEKLYTPQALSKNVNLSIDIVSPDCSTPFCKDKLLQIAGNLISNAIKFTPPEGDVKVDLHLVSSQTEGILRIDVKDTGAGLDEQALRKVLDGSARSTNGTTGEQGYGFGLALVKHLVDNLNGNMTISSKPGQGSTFSITLPQFVVPDVKMNLN